MSNHIESRFEGILTLKQLCGVLNISEATLRRHIRDDAFPKLRLGKVWRFDLHKVLGYMRQKAFEAGNVERKSLERIRKVAYK